MYKHTNTGTAVAVFLALVFALASTASAQMEPTVVAEGLNSPIGVLVVPGEGVIVTESGLGGADSVKFSSPFTGQMTGYARGNSARVMRFNDDGMSTLAQLPSLRVNNIEGVGAARAAMLNGSLYVTVGNYVEDVEKFPGMGSIYKIDDGKPKVLKDLRPYEIKNNPDTLQIESNAFAIQAGPDGTLWATDAAGNDLFKVDPMTGDLELVTVFDALPGPIPNAHHHGRMEMDPVPTGLAFDDDGNVYVSLLTGIPFPPGAAKVIKVAPDGSRSVYATGLTMLTDIERGPDGHFYVTSFGGFSEKGPVPGAGAVYRVKEGEGSEEVVGGLSFPTSIGFDEHGNAYVTVINSPTERGAGQLLRFDGMAAAH